MKINFIKLVMIAVIAVIFQSCDTDDPIIGKDLYFEAVNLSMDSNRENIAKSGNTVVSTTITISVTVNGETVSQSYSKTSNELFVLPGNEIEITFYPSCEEETEAVISLPDGTTQRVTTSKPSFTWIVPDDGSQGMKITGESHYERKGDKEFGTGSIILTTIK